MSISTDVIKAAIEAKRKEISELEATLRRLNDADTEDGTSHRRRRRTGFKTGSVPYLVNEILSQKNAPMAAADLAEELKKRGKEVTTNILAGSLNRYMDKIFERTADGMYALRR
jgi:hypothetical protein